MGIRSTVSKLEFESFFDHVGDRIGKRAKKKKVEFVKQLYSEWISTEVSDGFDEGVILGSNFIYVDQKNAGDMQRCTRKADDEQLSESIRCLRQPYNPGITWDSLAGLRTAKQELQIAVEMPRKQPQLFQGGLKACQFILLYGPPGNGKTHLARVIASNLQSTLYTVTASDLTSMWIGTSARLVRLMFQDARAQKPAIIFFDEVDAICGQRKATDSISHNEQKAELLAQMDGARFDNEGILFVGATNLPWALDPAFLRRFPKQLYIPLPDYETRVELLAIQLRETGFYGETDRNLTLQDLAKWTDGFSGSDIKKLVQEVLRTGLRKVEAATHFRLDTDQLYYPCERDDPGSIEMDWRQAQDGKIGRADISESDFEEAFKKVKPSVKENHLEEYANWTEKNESG